MTFSTFALAMLCGAACVLGMLWALLRGERGRRG